jgi:hypothetical protein
VSDKADNKNSIPKRNREQTGAKSDAVTIGNGFQIFPQDGVCDGLSRLLLPQGPSGCQVAAAAAESLTSF